MKAPPEARIFNRTFQPPYPPISAARVSSLRRGGVLPALRLSFDYLALPFSGIVCPKFKLSCVEYGFLTSPLILLLNVTPNLPSPLGKWSKFCFFQSSLLFFLFNQYPGFISSIPDDTGFRLLPFSLPDLSSALLVTS